MHAWNLRNRPFPIRMINCVNYIDFIGENDIKKRNKSIGLAERHM